MTPKVYAALFTTVILWASAFVGIRVGLTGYSPGGLALLRYAIASLAMVPVYFRLPVRHKINLKEFAQLILIGIIGFTIYNIALNYGEISVPAGIASFIVGLIPVFTIIFAVIFLKERLGKFGILGIIVTVFGLILIAAGEHGGVQFDVGVVYVLLSALCGSVYVILQKPLLIKFHPVEIVSFAIWTGTFFLLIFTPNLLADFHHTDIHATAAAIYMGIFPAAIAYGTWSYALSKLKASEAAPFLYALPFVTTLMAFFYLHEIPATLSLLGGVISLAGAFIATRRVKSKSSMLP